MFANIALMDALDRRIAAAFQLNGRATWREVARAVGTSESTVARRGQQLIDSGFVRVTGYADPTRCGLRLSGSRPAQLRGGHDKRVASEPRRARRRALPRLVTGTFDLLVELIVPSQARLAHVLLDELPRSRESPAPRPSRHADFKTSYDWSRDLLGEHGVDPSFVSQPPAQPARQSQTALSEHRPAADAAALGRRPAQLRPARAGPRHQRVHGETAGRAR